MGHGLPAKAKVLEFKVGNTVILGCTALDEAGLPVDLTGVTVESQARSMSGALICEMTFSPINPTIGTYELIAPDEAPFVADPETGSSDYKVDIRYSTMSGLQPLVRSTETFYLRFFDSVTV